MNVTKQYNISNDIHNFNYSFDYSDFNVSNGIAPHEPTVFRSALKATIMVGTFMSMFFMSVLMGKRINPKHRGFRWYSANLMLVNFIVMIVIVANDRDLSFLIKSHVSHSTFARFKAYNFDIIELSNIVYLSTTTFLIVEATNRYRRNGYTGLTHLHWFLISFISDIIPLIYVIIQQEFFPYAVVKPRPYAVYHLLFWILFGIASCSFITASLCCLRRRKNEDYETKMESPLENSPKFSSEFEHAFSNNPHQFTFNHRHLLRLSLYLLATMWIQWPTSYNVFPDLIPMDKVDTDMAMKIMPKVQPFIKWLLNINIWSTFCMPLVETLACLVFLPSFNEIFFPSESNFRHRHTATATTPF